MRRRLPGGWPGLVGIAILLGGSALAVGTPRLSSIGGPVVGDSVFANVDGPHLALAISGVTDNGETDAAAVALGEDGYAERSLTLVGIFDSNADARRAADAVALEAPARTLIVDRILVAHHLVPDPEDDPVPLTAELADLGADVLVQGDRFGEGQIVVDLQCRAGSHDAAAAIATALMDYGLGIPGMRPPWVGPPLMEDEALARSTYRRWGESLADAFSNDPWLVDNAHRFLTARSPAEYAALNAELEDRLRELQGRGLDGEVHPGMVAVLAAAPAEYDPVTYAEWQREMSRLVGALPAANGDEPTWFEQRQAASLQTARAVDDRVEIGWVFFNRFELGFTGLLAFIEQQGCDDVRVRLTDWDDVRVD